MDKCNQKDTHFPTFESVCLILQKAKQSLKLFKDYSFYSNAIGNYNHVVKLITDFRDESMGKTIKEGYQNQH